MRETLEYLQRALCSRALSARHPVWEMRLVESSTVQLVLGLALDLQGPYEERKIELRQAQFQQAYVMDNLPGILFKDL